GPFEAEEISRVFARVFDPYDEGRGVGPAPIRLTPEGYVRLTQARIAAIEALRTNSVDERALVWTRAEYLTARLEYAELLPRLVEADPETADSWLPHTADGRILLPPTDEEIVNR